MIRRYRLLTVIVLATPAWANFSGHIYATDGTQAVPPVQQNQFSDGNAVYLSGGPQNTNANGLPFGTYYFQITDPSGKKLLSEDDISCRQVIVTSTPGSGGKGVISALAPAVALIPACNGLHSAGNTDSNGGVPLQLMPFGPTPNGGGVFKLWLTPVDQWAGCATRSGDPSGQTTDSSCSGSFGFMSGSSKTDSFKITCTVGCDPDPQSRLSGTKYFDVNSVNTTNTAFPLGGILEPNDSPLQGWVINIYAGTDTTVAPLDTETTDSNGEWFYFATQNTQVTVCEAKRTSWTQSGPRISYSSAYTGAPVNYVPPAAVAANGDGTNCWQVSVGSSDVAGLNFGNYLQVTGTKHYSLNGSDSGTPVPNWPITVTCDATAIANLYCQNNSLTTDSNGNYQFLPTGPIDSYTVCEGSENNWVQTYPTVPLTVNGANAAACTMTSTGWSGLIGTATGAGLDFGNYATVSGTKFYSGTSTRLQGWTVTLNPGGSSSVTDATGNYIISVPSFPFTGGSVCETQQAGWTETSPDPAVNAGCYTYSLSGVTPAVSPSASSLDFFNEEVLSGVKFYDLNLDQAQDNGEPGISGFKIAIYSCLGAACTPGVTPSYVYTGANGAFQWAAPGPITDYKVCEILPPTGNWTEITMPSCYTGSVGSPNQNALNFGNVCEGNVNPYTQGFWHNSNGSAMLTNSLNYPGWASWMNTFNANGSYLSFVPKTTTTYGMSPFLGTNASKDYNEISSNLFTTTTSANAANMLSTQLATMELNTIITNGTGKVAAPNVNSHAFMKVGTSAALSAAGCNPAALPSLNSAGYATISDVEGYANLLLLNFPNTTASGPARSCQVLIQTALNNANNNQTLSIVQPTSCKLPVY